MAIRAEGVRLLVSDSDMKNVHRIISRAVARGDFPSACLAVARDGEVVIQRAYGGANLDTVFDLASLTKPLATTMVAMKLVECGVIKLADRASLWLPELPVGPACSITVRQLLDHSSGLPAWRPFHEQVSAMAPPRRRRAVRLRAARTPLEAAPGRQAVYSDLGFILLAWLLERIGGARLDQLARRMIFAPLGLERTFFISLGENQRRESLLSRHDFAPTEQCPWRGRRLVAEVHDDNCHAMGGVSGHAGLFSTVMEVHVLAHEVSAAWHGEPSILGPGVVRRFLSRPSGPAGTTRVLGWDTPSSGGSSSGHHFGPQSVGHLGFTGTSLWMDLPRRTWVVLLTNRVHGGRDPNPMPRLRPRVHDAVMLELGMAGR